MGASRITPGVIRQRILANLNAQGRRLFVLQEQLATGLRVNRPSDQPVDARRAVNARTAIQKNEQYLRNIAAAGAQLRDTAAVVQNIASALQRVRELTLQGANGTNSPDQLNSLAAEVNHLLEELVVSANQQTNGKYIFAGTRTLSPAFTVTRAVNGDITAVTYSGNDEHYRIATADAAAVDINETGGDVFQSTQDIFQTVISIRDNLRSGDFTSLQNARLAELSNAQPQLFSALGRTGAVQNRLERVQSDTETFTVQLEQLLSDSIDADFAETMTNLNAQQNAFQAALNAAARVIQPSLLDFVR